MAERNRGHIPHLRGSADAERAVAVAIEPGQRRRAAEDEVEDAVAVEIPGLNGGEIAGRDERTLFEGAVAAIEKDRPGAIGIALIDSVAMERGNVGASVAVEIAGLHADPQCQSAIVGARRRIPDAARRTEHCTGGQ